MECQVWFESVPSGKLPGEGEVCEMVAIGRPFCVARVNGEIAVLDGICPHNEGPLGQGIVENGRVVCPWHAGMM